MTEASVFGVGGQIKERNVATVITPVVTIATVTPNLVRSISVIGAGVQIKGRNAGTITTLDVTIAMHTPEPNQRTISLIGVGAFTKA
jgi:hypothetical protein